MIKLIKMREKRKKSDKVVVKKGMYLQREETMRRGVREKEKWSKV